MLRLIGKFRTLGMFHADLDPLKRQEPAYIPDLDLRTYGFTDADLDRPIFIDRFLGLEYGGCCWRFRLVARRYVSNRTGESDNSMMLELELKGLSSVGTRDDTFLQRSIRGYSPGSAALP